MSNGAQGSIIAARSKAPAPIATRCTCIHSKPVPGRSAPLSAAGVMVITVPAGAAYFAIVFLVAFGLGVVRTLAIAPRLGQAFAVLLEAPVILTASWFVAAWCVGRFGVSALPRARLAMGGVAFALLMLAELGGAVIFFHRPIAQYLADFLSPAGVIGLAAQLGFALVPMALTWRSWSATAVVWVIHTIIYTGMATATLLLFYACLSS